MAKTATVYFKPFIEDGTSAEKVFEDAGETIIDTDKPATGTVTQSLIGTPWFYEVAITTTPVE